MTESNDLAGIIEIRAPEIDAEAIMRQIRENIRRRRETAQAQGLDFDALAQGAWGEGEGRFAAVYQQLRRLNALYDRITVKQYISPRRVPLIGGLIQRVRAALHDLVIYYVNTSGSKQILFNETSVHLLDTLLAELEKDAARNMQEIAALREEVTALRAEVATLRSKQDPA